METENKAVLISIQPKWCELIASGKKTIEVRKTKPKLKPPFKCYIYCTKPREKFFYHGEYYNDLLYKDFWSDELLCGCTMGDALNGKVIGEFVCDNISTHETEFYSEEKQPIFEAIYEYNEEEDINECIASNDDVRKSKFLKDTCLDLEDFRKYLGTGENRFYGWHISSLKIYDEPCPLSNFTKLRETKFGAEPIEIARPPQSWCYVEEC